MGDYFSKQSQLYKSARPTYPEALFDYLSQIVPSHATVWDCATGNGQAALRLSQEYAHIIATDLSAQQLSQAPSHPNITFRQATAEDSGLDDNSVDLITVAQALHWFNFDAFYAEVKRVLKPGGYLAVWAYDLLKFEEQAINDTFLEFYEGTLWSGKYWPKERALIDERYASIPFPFQELDPPMITMEFPVTRQGFINYLGSWSAVQRYKDAHHTDPIEKEVTPKLQTLWPDPNEVKVLRCQLILRVGQN